MSINYKKINGAPIFLFSDLNEDAKAKARAEIIDSDRQYFNKDISDFKSAFQANIHVGINDKYKIPALIRRKAHINKTISDTNYCDAYIQANLCNFLGDGTYVTYFI